MTTYGQVSSITAKATSEPFPLQVARGQIAFHRSLNVFGTSRVVQTSEGTVWDLTGFAAPNLTSAVTMKVSSGSASDTSAGAGARTVIITGLDGNFNEVSETVTLTGQTAVNTANTYVAINSIVVNTVGSGGTNAGIVYVGTGSVTSGVPAVIYNAMYVGYGASTTGKYTIPAGYTGYVDNVGVSIGQIGTAESPTVSLSSVGSDGIRRYKTKVSFCFGQNNIQAPYPLTIPEKSTIESSAICTSLTNAIVVSTSFSIVLIRNGYDSGST